MKNHKDTVNEMYKDTFNETYKDIFSQHTRKMNRKGAIVFITAFILIYSFLGLTIAWTERDAILSFIGEPFFWISSFFLSIMIMYLMVFAKESNYKIYEEKAMEFATTIYFNDIIDALSAKFTLSQDFNDKLKEIMTNLCWYDDGFTSDIEFIKPFFEEKMRRSDKEYYLAGWTNTKKGFLFECKKASKKDQFKTVEFLLQ